MTAQPGEMLSHYRLVEKIGEGGMGEVFRAEDTVLGRVVAIKVLTAEAISDSSRRERFVREARTASSINHPNIAQVYELGQHEDTHFIAMEYVHGQTLRSISRQRRMPLEDVLEVIGQVADALAKTHERGIVHRDLKPENIMIDEDGRAKVLDFGLAKLAAPPVPDLSPSQIPTKDASLTRQGAVLGTVHYMSPEQALGQPVDHRSDVFSLGVVLYEMTTGARPFGGDSALEVLHAIATKVPRRASDVDASLPQSLIGIIDRALAKRPDDRYPSILDFRDDLNRLRNQMSAKGEDATRPILGREVTGVRRIRYLVIGLVPVILLAVAAYFLVHRLLGPTATRVMGESDAVPSSRFAVLPFTVHGGDDVAYLAEGMVDLLSTSLDGLDDWHATDPRALLAFIEREDSGMLDPERGRGIAERFRARTFILGNLVEAGNLLRITASLYDRDGTLLITAESAVDSENEIFGLVDDVSRQIAGRLASGPAAPLAGIAAETTSSLPAVKAYFEGEREVRTGEFHSAIEAFTRAVELDPAFALGWYRLALAASFSLDHVLAREASEEALNHVERLPGRQRRLLEAFQAFLRGDANQAEELYRSILHRHPDDLESWYLLGETLFHYNRRRGRSTAEAREAFERVLELDPGHHSALFHLISVAARQDDLDAVDSLAKRFNESFRGHRLCSWAQALQAFALDDLAAQERVLADERLQRESVVIFEQVALDTYNIPGLRRFLQPYLSPDLPPLLRSHAKRLLAPLSLAEGKWSQARSELAESEALGSVTVVAYRAYLTSAAFLELPREELEQAREAVLSLHNDPRISGSEVEAMGLHIWPYLPALLSARLGDTDTVLQHAAELEKVADPPEMGTLSKDLAFGLRARVASIDGQAAEALAWLEQARNEIAWVATTLPFASLGSERFLRAELLDELGRSEEALRWYASVADSVLDLVLLAPAHYRSGEICERLGRREEAVYHYSRVAEMWQDCDPELRSVLEGARERLKSLGAS